MSMRIRGDRSLLADKQLQWTTGNARLSPRKSETGCCSRHQLSTCKCCVPATSLSSQLLRRCMLSSSSPLYSCSSNRFLSIAKAHAVLSHDRKLHTATWRPSHGCHVHSCLDSAKSMLVTSALVLYTAAIAAAPIHGGVVFGQARRQPWNRHLAVLGSPQDCGVLQVRLPSAHVLRWSTTDVTSGETDLGIG